MLRALLFGFAGVLVDDERARRAALARVLAEEGLRPEAAASPDGSPREALAHAGRHLPADRAARLEARRSAYYREEIRRSGYAPVKGARLLVEEAEAAGLLLGLVAGAAREEVESALRQAGLLAHLKALVTAEDLDGAEPRPESFLRALAELNARPPLPARLVHPHEVLALDRDPSALAAARAAGLRALATGPSLPRLAELMGG